MAYRKDYADTGGEDNDPKVAWNIAAKQAQHISNLIIRATSTYLRGDLGKWYQVLTALREMINHDLKDDERKVLDTWENKINSVKPKWDLWKASIVDGQEKKELRKDRQCFSSYVKLYQRRIMDNLKDLGYFPDKVDYTEI